MTVNFTIEGRFPGLNELIAAERANKFKGAQMKAGYTNMAYYAAKEQLRGVTFTRPVAVTFRFVEKDRRRDLDNIAGFAHKVILDGLVQAGVLADDGWNEVTGISDSFAVDKARPRIEVTLEEVGDG